MSEARAAVIIPTFNEGQRVLVVAEAASSSALVDEVIIVNDGSEDCTAELLKQHSDDYTVLSHEHNYGKGEALDTGVSYARRSGHHNIVFLDADLQGVIPDHVNALLAPMEEEGVPMTIGYLGLRKALVKQAILNQWGALSGQRVLRADVWDLLSREDRHRFNVEAALNARLRKAGLHRGIARVALDGLGHVGKRDKEGSLPKAMWEYVKTYSSAMRTYARIELEDIAA